MLTIYKNGNLKKSIQEIEKRIKNIKSHIPKIIEAWENGIVERVIYYKKEMDSKIKETREVIESCNNHEDILKLELELDSLVKEIYLLISKYE